MRLLFVLKATSIVEYN